jgi:hypothetical protein
MVFKLLNHQQKCWNQPKNLNEVTVAIVKGELRQLAEINQILDSKQLDETYSSLQLEMRRKELIKDLELP